MILHLYSLKVVLSENHLKCSLCVFSQRRFIKSQRLFLTVIQFNLGESKNVTFQLEMFKCSEKKL